MMSGGFAKLIIEIKKIFASCNEHVSRKMTLFPNLHEPFFDQELVTAPALMPFSPPNIVLDSGWKCRVDVKFTGGVLFGEDREVADLAILVHFQKNGQPMRTKIALCQSKRLHPDRVKSAGGLYREKFQFQQSSTYKALKVNDKQYQVVEEWEKKQSIKVHYLLYNPCEIPSVIDVPFDPNNLPSLNCTIGIRVRPASSLRLALGSKSNSYVPSYLDLYDKAPRLLSYAENWRLEDFVASLLIGCKVGTIAKDRADAEEFYLRYQRGWPITSAIEITIDMPEDADLPSTD